MKALVVGRAFGVWSEVKAAKLLASFDVVICVNVAGRDYPGTFDHWVSLHPEHFERWMRERMNEGRPGGFKLWTAIHNDVKLGAHLKLPFELSWTPAWGGASGMLGVRVAIDQLKADRTVLCGIPMEDTPRYDDQNPWAESLVYKEAWGDYLPTMRGRVKSMSGWTADLLGRPDKEWLNGQDTTQPPQGAAS